MGNARDGSTPATLVRATDSLTRRRTPAVLWLFTVLAAVFLWVPVSGLGGGLASVPHTGRGCDAGSGPICGNQGEALWASAVFAAMIAALYLGALLIITIEGRRLAGRRHWFAPAALTAYAAVLFLGAFLLGRS